MIEKAPLKFRPYLKSVIWGGNRICSYKGIPQTKEKIGESWEISAVSGYESVVDGGVYDGKTLTELVNTFGAELLGESVMKKYNGKFPLLFKLLDANDRLSVQVHPDDKLAMKRHNSLGKTEMWYIIDAEKDARIYAGLNRRITPAEFVEYVEKGDFESLLTSHESRPGDVFFLPAGCVHTIGAGILLAEIQESSDITYRIYDYGRRDAQGNTRELHTRLAKDAIDYSVSAEYKTPPVADSVADAEIVNCGHFTTRRILLDGELALPLSQDSFSVLMCLAGEVTVMCGNEQSATIAAGHTLLLPAAIEGINLKGKGTLLLTRA